MVREAMGRNYDLLATGRSGRYLLLGNQGQELLSVPFSQSDLMIQRIAAEARIRRLLSLSNPHADLRVDLSLDSEKQQPELTVGDEVALRLTASEESYLLLLYSDPAGNLTVLYPVWPGEDSVVAANKAMIIPGLFIPSPPGRSFFQAFAFVGKPESYGRWESGDELKPGSPSFDRMLQFIEANLGHAAQTRLEIVTRLEPVRNPAK